MNCTVFFLNGFAAGRVQEFVEETSPIVHYGAVDELGVHPEGHRGDTWTYNVLCEAIVKKNFEPHRIKFVVLPGKDMSNYSVEVEDIATMFNRVTESKKLAQELREFINKRVPL